MHDSTFRTLLALACLALAPLASAASDSTADLSPKGIYHAVDEYQRTGIKFHVDLKERGRKARRVPVTHPFESGDRFTFTFEINRDSYIYVINRTVRGELETEPAGFTAKRIHRVYVNVETPPPPPPRRPSPPPPRRPSPPPEPEPTISLTPPRLLFPTQKAGSNNRLNNDVAHLVPNRGHYVMDDETGTERLYVVISDQRLDLDGYFFSSSGKVKSSGAASRLERKLADWKKNADVELVAKGITHEVESYGVSLDPSRPAVVEIDLQHCR